MKAPTENHCRAHTCDTASTPLAEHAVGYARAGILVLPLVASGKRPDHRLAPHGKDDATTDSNTRRCICG